MEELAPKPGGTWRRWEIDLLITAYFDLLAAQDLGEHRVKSDVNRHLQALLPARNRGSIEYKLQNVSGVLYHELHRPFVDGYKPAGNFQDELRRAVIERLDATKSLKELLEAYGRDPVELSTPPRRLHDVLVDRPRPAGTKSGHGGLNLSQGEWGAVRDAQLRALGKAGEKWVVALERAELAANGRDDLASQVEWTAEVHGDGFGYDVSSFEPDGAPTHIEVKTTNLGPRAPFLVTRNEVAKSAELARSYRLYRVFDFAKSPRVYVVNGAVASGFSIEPAIYQASV